MSENREIGLSTADYYFDLPQELIAQDPMEKRDECKLLVMDKETGNVEHHVFNEVINYLQPGDCLVLNNTKVIPARLLGVKEETGAAVEILLLKRKKLMCGRHLLSPVRSFVPEQKFHSETEF